MNIAKSTSFYEYWNSEQEEDDENKRLLKLNPYEPGSSLFRDEPYKWENLYQSVLRNVINGDESSLKGLFVLLSTISKKEKDIVLTSLEVLLNKNIIYKLRNQKCQDLKSNKNFYTALRILLTIFINPYELELKNEQKYCYEKIGMFCFRFRRIIN